MHSWLSLHAVTIAGLFIAKFSCHLPKETHWKEIDRQATHENQTTTLRIKQHWWIWVWVQESKTILVVPHMSVAEVSKIQKFQEREAVCDAWLTERSTERATAGRNLSVCFSVCLSVFLSVYLPIGVPIYASSYFIYLFYPSIYMCIYLPSYLSLPNYLTICLFAYLSVGGSNYLKLSKLWTIHLSI